MKCIKQPKFIKNRPSRVTDTWEVRLPQRIWQQVCNEARRRKSTFSQLTRYCVFRLIEKEGLRIRLVIQTAHVATKFKRLPDDHRHMVCFYGEDIRMVRLVAMHLGITVSALVRIALWLYLPRLAMEFHSRKSVSPRELFLLGIKRWLCVPIRAINSHGIPHIRQILFSSFPPNHWWPALTN